VLFVQEELIKTKLELAKTKEEVSKLKTQLQATSKTTTKTTKEEEKAKAKIAAKIQSLEAENGRLTSSVQAKAKELKKQEDISEKLDAEVTGLKSRVEVLQRELASAQAARTTTVRKQRDWAEEEDDYDDYGSFVHSKKSRLSLGRPSLEAMIQKQVSEALKSLVPPSQQAMSSSLAEGYQFQPLQQHQPSVQQHLLFLHQQQQQQHIQQPQHKQQQHQHMDPTGVPQRSFEPYQGRAGGHQVPVPPPVPHHVQTATTSAGVLPPLTWPSNPTTWSSSPIEVAVNTPLAAALTSTTAPQQPTQPTRAASPVGETAKADNASAQMFKAFMEFVATQKQAP